MSGSLDSTTTTTTIVEPVEQEEQAPGDRSRRRSRRRTREPGAGSSVGRYVVLELIGRGAMGLVLRAYDPKLQREVAIKLVSNDVLDTSSRDRMLREARAMALLSHPNVVALHDAEESDAGVMLVMEYVAGHSLRRWVARSRPPWTEIVDRFVEAGRGLAAAHATGLLHRDFKADNVLVAESGAVKVTDFGLAKLASAASTRAGDESIESSRDPSLDLSSSSLESPAAGASAFETSAGGSLDSALTRVGTVMGTPRYMAPEQHRGKSLTPSADQYAFCVALWEALVGAPPYRAQTLADLLVEKLRGPPPWPTDGPRIPRAIVDALRRGLAPEPAERWPSMPALLEVLARDPSRRRNRWLLALGGLGLGGLLISGWTAWVEQRAARCTGAREHLAGVWDRARREQARGAVLGIGASYAASAWARTEAALDRYADDWAAMHTATCEATTLRGEQSAEVMDLRIACLHRARVELEAVVDVLSHADAEVVENADAMVDSLASLDRCADVRALRATVQPPRPEQIEAVEQIRRQLAEAKAQREAGRYAQAQTTATDAEQRLAALEYEPVGTEVALEQGRILERLGRFEASEQILRRALASAARWRQLELLQQAAEALMLVVGAQQWRMAEGLQLRELAVELAVGDPEAEASARDTLADVLTAQGDYPQAEAEYRRALALHEQASGLEHPDVANTRSNLASLLDQQGKHEDAVREHRRALELLERVLGPEHPDTALARNNLAIALHSMGEYEEAEAQQRRALELHQRLLGPEHPQVAGSRNNLGLILEREGRPEEAEAEHRLALELRKKVLGPDHPDVAQSWNNLDLALYGQGEFEAAATEQRRALELQQQVLGPEHPDVAQSIANLGLMLNAQGEHERAEAELRRALALQQKVLGPEHPRVALSHNNLALALQSQGKPEAAEVELRHALRLHQQAFGPDHPMVALAHNNIGHVLYSREQYEQAAAEHRKALSLYQKALGPDHPDVAMSRNNLALSLKELGELEQVEEQYRRALAIWEQALGPEHPNVALAHNNLAYFLYAQERYPEALAPLEAAWERRQRDDTLPVHRASTAFLLARTLWKTSRSATVRARARQLARRAEVDFGLAGPQHEQDVARVRAWLDDPDAPPPGPASEGNDVPP